MVWVLSDPSSFGMFWPLSVKEGEYGSWHERTEQLFNEMPPDERARFNNRLASYRHFIVCKFSMMDGHKFNDKTCIGPLEPHEKPDEFHTAKTQSSLGSMIKADNQLLAVDQAPKDLIERLEPGLHEFWPIKIVMPKGAVYPAQFYGMVIRRFLDSFSPAQSAEGTWQRADNFESYAPLMPYDQFIPGLAFSKHGFGTSHLWREKKMYSHNILMSDLMQSEIKKAALRLPKLIRAKEVV